MTRIIIEIDGDDVNMTTETKSEETGVDTVSQYARYFDSSCPGWKPDAYWNLMYLKQQQKYMGCLLKKQGYLFLNDVYKALGMTPSKAGQIVGWIYDENNPIGDNYVDFGIYNITNNKSFNNFDKSILLDFNIDGEIISRI